MEALYNLIESAEERLKGRHLILVCNSKTAATPLANCEPFQMETEYFSDDEFDQIVSMFSSIGLPTDYFLNENDFFRYIISERPKNLVVYNAAQSGTGPGRKSLIPAFCNLHRVPCTGSNAYVVSLCRHKYHVNKLLAQMGIPVPDAWLYSDGWLMGKRPPQNSKVILKPIYESASIGIDNSSVQIYTDYTDTLVQRRLEQYRQAIIAQKFISGYEVEFPLVRVGEQIVPITAVGISVNGKEELGTDILDYQHVYFDCYNFYDFSSKDKILSEQLSKCAADVTRLLGMEGLCRVDFRINSDREFFVTDVSTNPHFVKHSSVYYAFANAGMGATEMARIILSAALEK